MKPVTEIGSSGIPPDVEEKVGELVDWIDQNFETKTGTTAMYWSLAYTLAGLLDERKDENSN